MNPEEKNIARIDLTNEEYMKFLLQYLEILMNGRVEPDRSGSGTTIRKSSTDNAQIDFINKKLTQIFKLKN